MPTYEYKCLKCGYYFEKFHAMSDAPVKKCPHCHLMAVQRLISGGAGIIFKGSGFYATDYKKKVSAHRESKVSKGCSSCAPSTGSCSQCKK
jgi:putative FmdB family regulatory protein